MTQYAFNRISLFIKWEALGTQRNTLVELYVVTNNTGSTDYNTCSMVNGKMAAYGCCRVYIDTRLTVCHLGDDTRYEGHAQQVQLMCYAVVADGSYGRIAADYLTIAGRCRVTFVGSHHIGRKDTTQMRQTLDEPACDDGSIGLRSLMLRRKAQPCQHLSREFMVEVLYVDPSVVGNRVTTNARVSEVTGEENSATQTDNLGQRIKRRQGIPLCVMI